MTDSSDLIRAAGGVVWRRAATGIEVLVVHRPRYDDWSLPKGKCDEGETMRQTAVREILEETGVTGTPGADLGEVRYTDHRGRPKVVTWFAVQADEQGQREDVDEVDEMRWLPMAEARELLTYDADAEVVSRFAATV